MISKLLVANRGEIARRVFRTCRRLGITTVAIASAPDMSEPHAREADEVIALEGAAPTETYLDIDKVLDAAKSSGADAIHPGYGFLSENAEFARRVTEAGLLWIGPSPEAIEVMGSKLASKKLMEESGVPTLDSVEVSPKTDAVAEAKAIGFPILVKASAGGGGKGMRIVRDPESVIEAVESATREAESAFGDGTVFLEKYLEAPRHIEIQVFGDSTGKVVSLHERECSIQRRHQKIVEESPSPVIDSGTRRAMGEAAVDAAKAVSYVGAGTVEFLYQDGSFYFLEMNTRLQVEHPVTEMVTGLDLVQLQLEVATGGNVPEPPEISGHAIEVRLYAEDPMNDFLPVTGRFHRFDFEQTEGLRVDAGIASGSDVGVHYDPMIAKVIAHAPTRIEAAQILASSLRSSHVHGSTTNLPLLVRILEAPEFLAGNTDTSFLDRHDVQSLSRPLIDPEEEGLAAVAAALADQSDARKTTDVLATIPSGWRNFGASRQHRAYEGPSGRHDVEYAVADGSGSVNGQMVNLGTDIGGFKVSAYGNARYVDSPAGTVLLTVVPRFPLTDVEDDVGSLHAPMPGKVVEVRVGEGNAVEEGDILIVMEAMKMEHTLRSPHDGTIGQVLCRPGDQVEGDAVLIVVEEN